MEPEKKEPIKSPFNLFTNSQNKSIDEIKKAKQGKNSNIDAEVQVSNNKRKQAFGLVAPMKSLNKNSIKPSTNSKPISKDFHAMLREMKDIVNKSTGVSFSQEEKEEEGRVQKKGKFIGSRRNWLSIDK